MDRYKRLASNTLILALGQFGSKLLVYVMMYFYTAMLDTEGYGAVGNIVDASTLIMALVTFSIGESVIRFGLDDKYDNAQVFSIGLTTTLTGLLLFIPFVPLIGLIDFLSEYSLLIYLYVFTGSIKSSCALFVRSSGHIRLYAVDGIYTTAVNIILNLVLLWGFNLGVLGYVLSVVLADLASIIFLFYMADLRRYFRLFGQDKHLRRAMLRFCIPMIPTTIMWWVTNVSDSFFVTAMMGNDANGIYKAAYKLPNIIALVSGIFSQAWNMSAITEKNSRTIARFYTDIFNFFQSIVYVLSSGMLLVIRPVLSLMTTESFTGTFRYAPLLVMSVMFTCFSTFMGSIYVASKQSVRSLLTASGGAVANLILNFLLIPIIGLQGAALATLISYLIIFFSRVFDTRRLVRMDLKPVKMLTNVVVISAMALIVIFVEDDFAFYLSLSALFLASVVLNFKTGIAALNMFLKRRRGG